MTTDNLPDLDKVKDAIKQAQEAEQELLKIDHNAVTHDDGHPIMAPNDEDRQSLSKVRHHGRRPGNG